jgi:hypothetical protein
LLHEHVQASTGCTIAAGPFRGMRLVPDITWGGGDVAAKLLGHYEAELHPVIERLVVAGFDQNYQYRLRGGVLCPWHGNPLPLPISMRSVSAWPIVPPMASNNG